MEEFSMPQSILQIVSEKGFDGLREIMQMLFNKAMKMERENYLHASPYQRTSLRTDHANGFKSHARQYASRQDSTGHSANSKWRFFIRPALKKECTASWV